MKRNENMKKVGIMSMQRIFNYGSFLQAYGLKELVREIDPNIDVKYIDYMPGSVLVIDGMQTSGKIGKTLRKLKNELLGKASISNKLKYINHKRTYAKRFFPLLEINDRDYSTNVDIQIIGSDEVFNCIQANINVGYSRDLFGHGSNAKKIVSYAASFGNTTMSKIQQYGVEEEISGDLSKFDAISVRDRNSMSIVEELIGARPSVNIDPALAYDFMRKEDKIPKNRLYSAKYMIVYGYSNRFSAHENDIIKKFSKENGLKVLCFGGVHACCDVFIDCNPFELLSYFRDAEYVLTDTFHGTIFSIINKKKFITLIRKSSNNSYGNEEKLRFLLDLFNLSYRGIGEIENQEILDGMLEKEIDYSDVFRILEEQRSKSKSYLKKVING